MAFDKFGIKSTLFWSSNNRDFRNQIKSRNIYLDFRNDEPIYKFFPVQTLILKALLRGYDQKITDNSSKYIGNGVSGVAELVSGVILTGTPYQ